jgi:hypothetical protein
VTNMCFRSDIRSLSFTAVFVFAIAMATASALADSREKLEFVLRQNHAARDQLKSFRYTYQIDMERTPEGEPAIKDVMHGRVAVSAHRTLRLDRDLQRLADSRQAGRRGIGSEDLHRRGSEANRLRPRPGGWRHRQHYNLSERAGHRRKQHEPTDQGEPQSRRHRHARVPGAGGVLTPIVGNAHQIVADTGSHGRGR